MAEINQKNISFTSALPPLPQNLQGSMRAAFDAKGEDAKEIVMAQILKEIEKLVKR